MGLLLMHGINKFPPFTRICFPSFQWFWIRHTMPNLQVDRFESINAPLTLDFLLLFPEKLQCRCHKGRFILRYLHFSNKTPYIRKGTEKVSLTQYTFPGHILFPTNNLNRCSSLVLIFSLYFPPCRPWMSLKHAVTSCNELKNYGPNDPC